MAFITLIVSRSLHSNFALLLVMIFLSSYFRYLSKEIIPKVLGFDFKRDFQSNFKTKLKENNLNTQWKWWTVCMPRLKRLIVPHSVKVKISVKYRKHWKPCEFSTVLADRDVFGSIQIFAIKDGSLYYSVCTKKLLNMRKHFFSIR